MWAVMPPKANDAFMPRSIMLWRIYFTAASDAPPVAGLNRETVFEISAVDYDLGCLLGEKDVTGILAVADCS